MQEAFLNLSPSSLLIVSVLFALLLITYTCLLVKKFIPSIPIQDFMDRLKSWWIVFGYLALIASSHYLLASFLLFIIILQSLNEYLRAIAINNMATQAYFYTIAAAQTALLIYQPSVFLALLSLLAVITPLLIPSFSTKISSHDNSIWQYCLYSFLIIFSLSHSIILINLQTESALLWFCCAVLLTQLNDVYQYLCGKIFGKHKITPVISPNKTYEGVIGGIVLTSATSFALLNYFYNPPILTSLSFGLMIGILGFIGDILFSLLKRKRDIKDFGIIFPGFGGLLDRVDSCTLTLPAGVYFFWISSSIN